MTDLETKVQIVIRQLCKRLPGPVTIDTEQILTAFKETYVGYKINADEYLSETTTDASLNKTFFESKPTTMTSSHYPVKKLSVPKFNEYPK